MNWKQLLVSITSSVAEEIRLRNAYLVTENRILRHQITGRVPLSDGDRQALAEIGQKWGRKALAEIATIVKPDTILAWHHQFATQQCDSAKPHTSVGRPRIDQELEALVVRMARENRSWGYDRVVGALANLGYTISDQTVGNILKRHGIPPAPERKKTVTWREFIRSHMDVLGATHFFSSEIWTWFGFVISYIFSFIRPARCQIHIASIKTSHHERWMLPWLPWSLEVNASMGSWRDSVKEETRSRWVLFGVGILRQPLSESVSHHQGRLCRPMRPVVFLQGVTPYAIRDGPMRSRQWLGELSQYDNREAA